MSEHKLENLVVLEYDSNILFTKVREAQEVQEEINALAKKKEDKHSAKIGYYDFTIDLEKGTWSWGRYRRIKIGNSRGHTDEHQEKIIGVYDRTYTEHLSNMALACHSIEATKKRGLSVSGY